MDWKRALRERAHWKMRDRWKKTPTIPLQAGMEKKFIRPISKLYGQFLTGHCELYYQIKNINETKYEKPVHTV